jgi:hypothetical protein
MPTKRPEVLDFDHLGVAISETNVNSGGGRDVPARKIILHPDRRSGGLAAVSKRCEPMIMSSFDTMCVQKHNIIIECHLSDTLSARFDPVRERRISWGRLRRARGEIYG